MPNSVLPQMMDRTDRKSTLLSDIEFFSIDAARKADSSHKSFLGQFMTPKGIAEMMATMFSPNGNQIHLLDAGAGTGILTAAFVAHACQMHAKPKSIHAVVYECDPVMCVYLKDTLRACEMECDKAGIKFSSQLHNEDFISSCAPKLHDSLLIAGLEQFDCAIINPPYKKITDAPALRQMLESIGADANNLYSAFLSIAVSLLKENGELVAITPRSFCNGTYFKTFRKTFLNVMALDKIHTFTSRDTAFKQDDVLQENIIFHAVKSNIKADCVTLTANDSPEDIPTIMRVPYAAVVKPGDPDAFIRIVPDELSQAVTVQMDKLSNTLCDLGLEVSTGKVVDFRAEEYLKKIPAKIPRPLFIRSILITR